MYIAPSGGEQLPNLNLPFNPNKTEGGGGAMMAPPLNFAQ